MNMKELKIKRIISLVMIFVMLSSITVSFAGCKDTQKEKILIYTSVEDYLVEFLQQDLTATFPDYDIVIEYLSTGDHAAKLMAEGKNSECDITYDLEYPYMEKLEAEGYLANLENICDISVFKEDLVKSKYYVPQCLVGSAIIVNTDLLKKNNLPKPTSYRDLLDEKYKDMISMPNPKSSGTGYVFYLSLVNAWGEEKALEYFDSFTDNVFQYTSSGSGPINALLQGEAAIGLGMIGQAVLKMNEEDAPFEILVFDEGAPYSMYGQGIVAGKESRDCVKKVFKYLAEDLTMDVCAQYFPESIYEGKTFDMENYPKDIQYANMENNTPETKEGLLAKWKY